MNLYLNDMGVIAPIGAGKENRSRAFARGRCSGMESLRRMLTGARP